MDNVALKAALAEILKYENYGKEINFRDTDTFVEVNLDIYTMTSVTARRVADLAYSEHRACIFTIQSIDNPKLQIRI